LRQALRIHPEGQLRHDLLRDPVPGLQRTGLRRLWRWHRADLRGADDCAHQVGDESQARLAAAFSPIDNGVCPAPAFKASDTLRKAEASRVPYLARSPVLQNRDGCAALRVVAQAIGRAHDAHA
jgi:hypothetical protein